MPTDDSEIRQGAIFWLTDCPPLHGREEKTRPVVVVSTKEQLGNQALPILLVAGTTTPGRDDAMLLIELPSTPQSKTGLRQRTWVIPEWALVTTREQLCACEKSGFVANPLMARIMKAFLDAAEAGATPRVT